MAFSFIDNLLRTPGFNPNAEDEYSKKKRAVVPSKSPVDLPKGNVPRATPSLPFERVGGAPATLPESRPMPAIASAQPTGNVIDSAMSARPGGLPGAGREQVTIPSLPWEKAGSRPYSESRAREYDYYRGDPMGQAEADRISGGINNANVGKGIGGFLNRLKSGLKPGLIGLTQGGIGGGIAGLIGGAVSPTEGRKYEFENIDKPKLIERQQREDQERARQAQIAKAQRDEQDSIIDRTLKQAQTQNIGSEIEARGAKARMDQMDTESQIRLRDAQAEATRTGKPRAEKLTLGDGKVHLVNVYPDGNSVDLGVSGDATLTGQKITSQEKIASERNNAAMARTQAQQSGADRRKTASGGSGKKYVSITDIREYARKHGISESQATAKARQEGFIPVK